MVSLLTGPDHPRSRGVYQSRGTGLPPENGSSPLARGLRAARRCRLCPARIIPARAGFTCPVLRPSAARTDHPRSRGVYVVVFEFWVAAAGSSPLARGLRCRTISARTRLGIIPARAGFTDDDASWVRSTAGSSPLARGLLLPILLRRLIRRIIPARAGFTSSRTWSRGRWTDHPRSRGVYCGRDSRTGGLTGSSPLARGLRDDRDPDENERGIIPARAGFTGVCEPCCTGGQDHPRSRGVYPSSLGKIRLAGVVLLHCLPNERSAELRKRLRRAAMDQVSLGGLTAPGMGDVPPFFFP